CFPQWFLSQRYSVSWGTSHCRYAAPASTWNTSPTRSRPCARGSSANEPSHTQPGNRDHSRTPESILRNPGDWGAPGAQKASPQVRAAPDEESPRKSPNTAQAGGEALPEATQGLRAGEGVHAFLPGPLGARLEGI